jgi:hypothetical protein
MPWKMEKEDFLQIFKSGFHKLNLKKLVKVGESDNGHGKKIGNYLGLFEFVPPEQVWMDEAPIDYDFLKSLMEEFDKELSNVIVRQYTRKVVKNSKTLKKTVTKYVFDIVPKNVLAFRFYRKTKTMRLVVKGYCLKR